MEAVSKPVKVTIGVVAVLLVVLIVFLGYKMASRGDKVSAEKEARASISAQGTASAGVDTGGSTGESTGDMGHLEESNVTPLAVPTARTTDEPARKLDTTISTEKSHIVINYGEYKNYTTGSLTNNISAFDYVSRQASELRLDTKWTGPYGTPRINDCGIFTDGGYFFCDTNTGYRLISADQPKNPLVAIVNIEGNEVPKEIYQRLSSPKFTHATVKVDGVDYDAWVLDSELNG